MRIHCAWKRRRSRWRGGWGQCCVTEMVCFVKRIARCRRPRGVTRLLLAEFKEEPNRECILWPISAEFEQWGYAAVNFNPTCRSVSPLNEWSRSWEFNCADHTCYGLIEMKLLLIVDQHTNPHLFMEKDDLLLTNFDLYGKLHIKTIQGRVSLFKEKVILI